MRKLTIGLLFAALGIATCFAAVLVTTALRAVPPFPAFAGEDDFSTRLNYFLLLVCPGFALIGVWIGQVFLQSRRAGGWMWAGVLAGCALTFATARILSPMIANIGSRGAANRGVLVLFLSWVALSALGAWVARRVVRER